VSVHVRLLLIVLSLLAASRAHAAPWSFELPDGYTEQPGVADAQLEALRKVPRTVSVDAQVYLSPDGTVRLTRVTWLSQFDVPPTKGGLESLERGVIANFAKQATKHISDGHHFAGDQLVGEQVDEVGGERVQQRRLYSADRDKVVHLFWVICAGPPERLGACTKAQQSMQLTLPNAAPLSPASAQPTEELDVAYVVGLVTGVTIVLLLVVWFVRRKVV
jgi:hypothetical protein